MLSRASLDPMDPKFMPLYRERSFQTTKRCLTKYIEANTWYKNIDLKDQYRSLWKLRLNRYGRTDKGRRLSWLKRKEKDTREIVCTMFIPSSYKSDLLKKINDLEEENKKDLDWKVKSESLGFHCHKSLSQNLRCFKDAPKGTAAWCAREMLYHVDRKVSYTVQCVKPVKLRAMKHLAPI